VRYFDNYYTEESPFRSMHLQWFAAEDEGRTEDPTEYKIKKAREEGKVAKSMELSSAIVLLFPIVAFGLLAPNIINTAIEMIRYFISIATEIDITMEKGTLRVFMQYLIKLTLPVGAVAFVSAILGNLMQVGFLFTTKVLKPDLKKITPNFSKFIKRVLFSSEALFNLAKSIVKIIIIGIIAFLNVRMDLDKIAHFYTNPVWINLVTISKIAFRIVVEAALAMLALGLPDYLFQRKQYRDSLKMTKHEVKEERKMHEGDPLVQNRLRERMREILSRNIMKSVPEADVVITNPTHYAVALEWDRLSMTAPMVTAKGQDHLAQRMKEIAGDHDVPIIENKPLARALYAEVELGDVIPEKYYEVMAGVLAQVYKMQGRGAEAVS
jgi:flagellar biosynthesis protein FlhB